MSTLAEIIEEGKRLEEAYLADQCAMRWDALVSFQHRNFPRLLAVAEIAAEIVEDPYNTEAFDRLRAAFDAAASGEGRG